MRKAREEMEKLPAQEQDRQPVMQQAPAATPAPDQKQTRGQPKTLGLAQIMP